MAIEINILEGEAVEAQTARLDERFAKLRARVEALGAKTFEGVQLTPTGYTSAITDADD